MPSTRHDLDRVLTTNDLVNSDHCYFVATGVTNGDMVRGVSYHKNSATTRSLVMRSKSGTIRHIESVHQLAKLQEYSVLDYTPKTNPVLAPAMECPFMAKLGCKYTPQATIALGRRYP